MSENKEFTVKVNWDKYNTGLLTAKVYRIVEKGKAKEATIIVKHGSLFSTLIFYAANIVVSGIAYDFTKYLFNRIRKSKKTRLSLESATIIFHNQTIVIRGEDIEELDELRKRFF